MCVYHMFVLISFYFLWILTVISDSLYVTWKWQKSRFQTLPVLWKSRKTGKIFYKVKIQTSGQHIIVSLGQCQFLCSSFLLLQAFPYHVLMNPCLFKLRKTELNIHKAVRSVLECVIRSDFIQVLSLVQPCYPERSEREKRSSSDAISSRSFCCERLKGKGKCHGSILLIRSRAQRFEGRGREIKLNHRHSSRGNNN